jgi:hypothetical protein
MATVVKNPFPPLGEIYIRIDRVYGKPTIYPACPRSELIAELAGTKTLTHSALCSVEKLGFTIKEVISQAGLSKAWVAHLQKTGQPLHLPMPAGSGVKS